jgi:hypothetical protein
MRLRREVASAQIALPMVGATSHSRRTLGEMLISGQKVKTVNDYYLRKEVNKK